MLCGLLLVLPVVATMQALLVYRFAAAAGAAGAVSRGGLDEVM